MKPIKLCSIILVNILLCAIILKLADFAAFYYFTSKYWTKVDKLGAYKDYTCPKSTKFLYDTYIVNKVWYSKYRPIENKNSKLKPIVLFGCSFTHGVNLENNETFSYQLGQITQRPIYNRALGGMGTQHMLFQLQNEDFYRFVPKPEFIIYTHINDHLNRINFPVNFVSNDIFYSQEKFHLRLKQPSLLNRLPLYILRKSKSKRILEYQYSIKNLDFFILHLLECKKEVENHWGKDVKFVIFMYENVNNNHHKSFNYIKKELEEHGFIVIALPDLTEKDLLSQNYQISSTDSHPNAKAWEEITPLLVEKLKINN